MVGDRSSWPPEVFDRLYARDPDPWGFHTSQYERDKYAATLAALPPGRFAAGFEVGCSIGVLTRLLAARCDALLSVDVSEAALAAARDNCAGLPHVELRRLHIPAEWPPGTFEPGTFDLIVLSEVLYFLGPEDLAATARLAAASLAPGGVALLVNWTGPTNSPCTGDEAAGLFIAEAGAAAGLTPPLQRREAQYRLDLLRRDC